MDLSSAIDEYLAGRRNGGYAKNTVRTETQALKLLLAEIGNIRVKDLDARHGAMFKEKMLAKGFAPGTVNLYRGAFGRFAEWCQIMRYLPGTSAVLATARREKDIKKPRRRVPRLDFDRLLDLCDHPQQRIIVALGLYLFLRASEISDLSVQDVDLDEGEIQVFQRKTGKYDTMPITEELDAELRRWLTWYAGDMADKRGALRPEWPLVPARIRTSMFNDGSGKGGGSPFWPETGHMNPDSRLKQVHTRIQPVLERFGWEVKGKREGEHTLRRSGARALYDDLVAGGAVKDDVVLTVSAFLHHESPLVTLGYIGVEPTVEKRNAMFKGKRMYRALPADNVIELRKVEEA
jgi:integrase